MSLGFVADIHGLDVAMKITDYIEYDWNKNKGMINFLIWQNRYESFYQLQPLYHHRTDRKIAEEFIKL